MKNRKNKEFRDLLSKLRATKGNTPGLADIQKEVEIVRKERYAKKKQISSKI